MKQGTRTPAARRDWAALAQHSLRNGDLAGARAAFEQALRRDGRNARLHHGLALVLRETDDVDGAAEHLTRALKINPQADDSARLLSRLVARFALAEPHRLDPLGLKAALAFDTVDRQALAEAAFQHLLAADPQFADAVAAAGRGGGRDTARRLLAQRTAAVLTSDLLLVALRSGVIMRPNLEALFTAVRHALLIDVAAERFEDRSLSALALALMVQGWNNDHAWAESDAEAGALAGLAIDKAAIASGDLSAGRRLLLHLLYRKPEEVLASGDPSSCEGLRPRQLRELVAWRLAALAEQRAIATHLPRLADLGDATSRRVATQYERSPYPRWESLHVPASGSMRAGLEHYFSRERLSFMDRPFDVLIAGAGTGQQAVQSAFGYGPNARILAIDLSAASLAYARAAATRYEASNIEFLIADILDVEQRLDRHFDIVECVGVLHHMADPWAGWRQLLTRLRPGGLMYVGLYSAVSRANIGGLRADPASPGPGCDDRAARAWRATLLARGEGEPGFELRTSRNFYALNEFRDLVLHESERHLSLGEIGQFLGANGLSFRGFTLEGPVMDDFASRYPDDARPGKLENWASFERDNPRTFDAMYRFWCEQG